MSADGPPDPEAVVWPGDAEFSVSDLADAIVRVAAARQLPASAQVVASDGEQTFVVVGAQFVPRESPELEDGLLLVLAPATDPDKLHH